MPNTYLTTLQLEFVLRACASYMTDIETHVNDITLPRNRHEQFESHFSKESTLWKMLSPRLTGDLKASKRMEAIKPDYSAGEPKAGQPKVYSQKVQSETERTLEILKRPAIGIECINTFREDEVCGHDRAHHFKVQGKKNPICRQIGCPCDNFMTKPKEKAFSNNLGLSFDDFKID